VHQALRSVLPVGLSLAVAAGTVPALAAPAPAEHAPVAAAPADGVPETMASSVAASDRVVDPAFPVDFVAVTWVGAHGEASVRFRHGTRWTPWQGMGEDGVEEEGSFASSLVPAGDADAYQVRIPAGVRSARSVAINTTDGEPQVAAASTDATASASAGATASAIGTGAKTTWGVVTRAGWGADEKLRLTSSGKEKWPQTFSAPQKFTVHHTAGRNDDPDPAATVRAIYRFHTIDRGWGDIGYQFLIDAKGTVYEGRQTDTTTTTPPAFDAKGRVVQGAHVADHNSGNVGISLLGTYSSRRPSAATQSSLERLLASLVVKTGISPTGKSTYDNGAVSFTGPNILGHRDMGATTCPGGETYALLPTIRKRVAERVAGSMTTDTSMMPPRSLWVRTGSSSARFSWWTVDDPSDTQLRYWPAGDTSRAVSTPVDAAFVERHRVSLTKLAPGDYQYKLINTDMAGNRRVTGTFTFRVG
jgi:hypothetical protein